MVKINFYREFFLYDELTRLGISMFATWQIKCRNEDVSRLVVNR